MKYTCVNKVEVDFYPWFDPDIGHHRFTYLQIFEALGGDLPYGQMGMVMNGSKEALKLDDEERTGELTITDTQDGGISYTIPIFITRLTRNANIVNIDFLCIPKQTFVTDLKTELYKDAKIKDVIESAYPGKVDFRTEPDIQDSLDFYQNQETLSSFCSKLCYSYKKNSVFGYSWDGLFIKDVFGEYNSRGNMEPDDSMWIRGDSEFAQLGGTSKSRDRGLYFETQNLWEDKKGIYATKDYSEVEPINLRMIRRFNTDYYFNSKYSALFENFSENQYKINSSLYQGVVVSDFFRMPGYKLGDVLNYNKESYKTSESFNWPYKYYLVRSNELFISIDGLKRDVNGQCFSWTSYLVGLEEDGTIAINPKQDPTVDDKK